MLGGVKACRPTTNNGHPRSKGGKETSLSFCTVEGAVDVVVGIVMIGVVVGVVLVGVVLDGVVVVDVVVEDIVATGDAGIEQFCWQTSNLFVKHLCVKDKFK